MTRDSVIDYNQPKALPAILLNMSISVVIPVLNEEARIGTCVERAWLAGADEVVVVDGGSTDSTMEILNRSNCRVLPSKPGRGTQLNCGAKSSSGDWIVCLHADNWFGPGAFHPFPELNPKEFCWGGFKQKIDLPGLMYRGLEKGNAIRAKWQHLVYGDQGLFMNRLTYSQVGGIPEFPLMEDFELSLRLSKISKPHVLPGPIHVDARRWQTSGVIRQTLRNFRLTMAYRLGATPESLAGRYRRHDQEL